VKEQGMVDESALLFSNKETRFVSWPKL